MPKFKFTRKFEFASGNRVVTLRDLEDDSATLLALRRPDLVDTLPKDFIIGHRGASQVYPEHSMEGYAAVAAQGWVPEQDIYALSTGELVCIHDSTVDRTMDGTGAVSSLTTAQWEALRIKPLLPGLSKLKPVYWNQVLDRFGGRTVLCPEIKAATGAVTEEIVRSIAKRGLHRAVIVQSFDYAAAKRVAAEGIAALYLSDTVGTSGVPIATVKADGIEFVGCSTSASQTYVQNLVAAGLKVIVYTVNDPVTYAARKSWGATSVFSDNPWKITRDYTPLTYRDRFDVVDRVPGESVVNTRLPISQDSVEGGLRFSLADTTTAGAGGVLSSIVLARFGYGVQFPLKIRFKAQALPSKGGAGFSAISERNDAWLAGIYVGTKDIGGPMVESGNEEWALSIFRRSGRRAHYQRVGSTITPLNSSGAPTTVANYSQQATDLTTDILGGAEQEYEFEITADTIYSRVLTQPDAVLSSPYTPLTSKLCYVTLRAKSTDVVIRDVRINR